MGRAGIFLSLAFTILFSGLFFGSFNAPYKLREDTNITNDPITYSIRSSVGIGLEFFSKGGTGVIIGRKKLNDGWRYNILTAFHLFDEYLSAPDQLKNMPGYSRIRIAFLTDIKNQHVCVNSYIDEIIVLNENMDWMVFSTDIPYEIPCAKLASREDFENIKPYEHIYGIGNDGMCGLLFREGVISSFNVDDPYPSAEIFISNLPLWVVSPTDYFRPSHSIWPGASGGPLFTKDGKIIGIYIAIRISGAQPVSHAGVALKTHLVNEFLIKNLPHILTEEN